MELVVTTGAINRAKLQSNHHHQQTNTQLFYRPDALPVAQPTVSKHWRENITFHGLAYPSSPGGLPTLSLTTSSSWLPWGRVAMSLISPLMPVPQCGVDCKEAKCTGNKQTCSHTDTQRHIWVEMTYFWNLLFDFWLCSYMISHSLCS